MLNYKQEKNINSLRIKLKNSQWYRGLATKARAEGGAAITMTAHFFRKKALWRQAKMVGYFVYVIQLVLCYILPLSAFVVNKRLAPTDYSVRAGDLKAYIEKEIQVLPLKMRLIFEMSRKENISHKEIVEQLNVS